MKIALFNYLPMKYGGGLAAFFQELAAGLHKRHKSAHVEIVSFDDSTAKLMQGLYSVFYGRNEFMKPSDGEVVHPMAHALPQLGRLLSRYDIVYSKNDILDLTLLSMARFAAKLPPVIVGFHTPVQYAIASTVQARAHNILYSSLYYRSLLKQAAGFHVLNNFHETRLTEWFPALPVIRVHNPIDESLLKPSKTTKKGSLKLLWVGRLTKDKGCDDLMRLVREGRHRNVAWTIVGDGAMRPDIENIRKSSNNVTYFPHMNRATLLRDYKRHDAFVTTSRWECLPYTVLEAQLSGLPVLGYDIPGVNDIVTPESGRLSKTFDDLSHSLETFKSSKFSARRISSSAARRFDPEDSYKTLYSLFKSVYGKSLR